EDQLQGPRTFGRQGAGDPRHRHAGGRSAHRLAAPSGRDAGGEPAAGRGDRQPRDRGEAAGRRLRPPPGALQWASGCRAASDNMPPKADMAIGNMVKTLKPKPSHSSPAAASISAPPSMFTDRAIAPPAMARTGARKA